jgi:hypothetical protein
MRQCHCTKCIAIPANATPAVIAALRKRDK